MDNIIAIMNRNKENTKKIYFTDSFIYNIRGLDIREYVQEDVGFIPTKKGIFLPNNYLGEFKKIISSINNY
jgi:hypothetical protein